MDIKQHDEDRFFSDRSRSGASKVVANSGELLPGDEVVSVNGASESPGARHLLVALVGGVGGWDGIGWFL